MSGRALVGLGRVGAVLAGALCIAAAPQSPQPAVQRTVLQTVEVPGSSYQVIEVKVEIAANAHVPKHTHPGSVIGYVVSGEYSVHVEGQPLKSVAPGETWVVPSGAVHEEMAGAHGAVLIAVFTVEKGKPLTSPVP